MSSSKVMRSCSREADVSRHQRRFLRAATAALHVLFLAAGAGSADHDVIPDPPPLAVDTLLPAGLRIDPDTVTVSGLSSGGFFAHQFHVANSGLVNGAGILAGGPYACTEIIPNPFWPSWRLDPLSAALVGCTHYYGSWFWGLRPRPPSAGDAAAAVETAYGAGDIDDPANLADDRVWLFHGLLDDVVPPAVAESLADLYRFLGVDAEALRVHSGDPERPASHGMPVDGFAGESRFPARGCDEHEPPFIIECGWDAAGLLLRHLHPDGFPDVPGDPHGSGSLTAFDQSAFFEPSETIGLSKVGYIYVPDVCGVEECRLHVAFHGCRQNADAQGAERVHDDFIRDAGYNRWAAAARIVVLYPQATETEANPNGCWDFWGYGGPGWRTKDGLQMRAVRAMIDRLLEG